MNTGKITITYKLECHTCGENLDYYINEVENIIGLSQCKHCNKERILTEVKDILANKILPMIMPNRGFITRLADKIKTIEEIEEFDDLTLNKLDIAIKQGRHKKGG